MQELEKQSQPENKHLFPHQSVPDATRQRIKSAVHKELIRRLDLEHLNELKETRAGQSQLLSMIQKLMMDQGVPLSAAERDKLSQEIVDEVFGLGPIEPLLNDP